MNAYQYQTIAQSASASATGELRPGTILPGRWGCYRIERVLHRTMLNAIYLAVTLASQKLVIIKENSYTQWSSQQRHRIRHPLEHEGALLRSLRQHGLTAPQCLDTFKFQDHVYLVMAKILGQTLAELDEQGQVTETMAISVAIHVCRVLHRLHGYGYVHHDVKPGNIMIGPDGSYMLIDYGAAEKIRPEGHRQLGGSGTPEFMSLEQIGGEARPDNDVFGVGRLLELIVLNPAPHLAAIIGRATAPAGQRYRTAAEFAQDLECLQRRATMHPARALLHQAQAKLHRSTVSVILIVMFLVGSIWLRGGLVRAESHTQEPPLLPILATATSIPAALPAQADEALPPVQDTILIRQCYERYQRSRVRVFASLDIEQLECVQQGSPLWQRIKAAVEELHERRQIRKISHRSEVHAIDLNNTVSARMTVNKIDTRLDFMTGCHILAAVIDCSPVEGVTEEQYVAIFLVERTGMEWDLVDVALPNE